MTLKRSLIFGAGLSLFALFPACKERGEVKLENLSETGYELSQEALFRAAESDDVRAMKTMIEAGQLFEATDASGRTALHAAAGAGAIQSISFLLDRGLSIDVTDSDGRTPLMEAVLRSTPETVRYLLRQGANPSLKDSEKFKPLMLAVRDGRRNMVPELAPYVREDLDDALLAAAILGQAGVIDELTNFGASVYARIEDGRSPLMLAAQNGHSEAVDMLLEIGANRFAVDDEGRTARLLAIEAGQDLLAERLEEEPQEGDFELTEPAELGSEMAAMVTERLVLAEVISGQVESGELEMAQNAPDPSDVDKEDDPSVVVDEEKELTPMPLEGAVLSQFEPLTSKETAVSSSSGKRPESQEPIVMRSYRQRELPLRVEAAEKGIAELRIAGGETRKIGEGSTIPGTPLKVIRVHRKMQSGKENAGELVEVSVVEVQDINTGVTRDLIAELPALAHDPVALVEDTSSGQYYVARTGQRFQSADGTSYLVGDVRPNQVVIENMKTKETTTIPLRGPRG